jgi:hypothetical protein
MPFTPFHFGPGLLVKGVIPGGFSWTTFVAAQVVIDCEPLYFMIRHEYPVHRVLHTLIGATIAGGVTAMIVLQARRSIQRCLKDHGPANVIQSESSKTGVWLGGLIGGISHPLLDGLMHPDVHPFAPITNANFLLDSVSLSALHLGCLFAGALGAILIWVQTHQAHRRF